jgi:hypothetical protein
MFTVACFLDRALCELDLPLRVFHDLLHNHADGLGAVLDLHLVSSRLGELSQLVCTHFVQPGFALPPRLHLSVLLLRPLRRQMAN